MSLKHVSWIGAISVILWCASLAVPAIETHQEVFSGWSLLWMGMAALTLPAAAFESASVLSWYANVFWAISLVCMRFRKSSLTRASASAAVLLTLLAFFSFDVPLGPDFESIAYTMLFGGYMWIAAMMLWLASLIVADITSPQVKSAR